MKFPLASTVSIGRYVAAQQRKGQRYPLVLMMEPTLACNIACIGCGKIREYESNKARLTVEECIDAGVQCPAPVVSIRDLVVEMMDLIEGKLQPDAEADVLQSRLDRLIESVSGYGRCQLGRAFLRKHAALLPRQ